MSENPFNYLDLNLEEAIQENQKINYARNKQICLCGHPIGRHKTNIRGEMYCQPNALICKCREKRPVLTSQDIRHFLRTTTGSGMLHALTRGITTCVERGIEIEWLIPMVCDKCKQEAKIVPMALTENLQPADKDTGINALLCNNCRTGI